MPALPLLDLEQMVVDAWPAREAFDDEGWWLRASGGPTHRGNSVATLVPRFSGIDGTNEMVGLGSDAPIVGEFRRRRPVRGGEITHRFGGDEVLGARGSTGLDARIERAERWYRERGLAAMFQVGPCAAPAGLDAALEARGYARAGEAVFSAALASVVLARSAGEGSALSARVERAPGDTWLAITAGASRFAATHDVLLGFLERLGARCRYVTVFAGREPAAVCLGISSERRLGVYAMLTLPAHRRRGAARKALYAMAQCAVEDGVPQLYLLVERENDAARGLYFRCGFGDVYVYHYRVGGSELAGR